MGKEGKSGGSERELTVSRPRVMVPTNLSPLIGHTMAGYYDDVSSANGIDNTMKEDRRRGGL